MNKYILFLLVLFSQEKAFSDILWTDQERSIIQSLWIKQLPPLSDNPSNRYANNTKAQQLGELLFFDKNLSIDKTLSCASCHSPEKFFTDGLALSRGVKETGRNSISVVGSSRQRWFYWDGRKDSLWSQALIPFEAPDEMGNSRVAVVKTVITQEKYKMLYQNIFGRIPSAIHPKTLPDHAGPFGSNKTKNAWFRLSKTQKTSINRIYANIGKTLEAYQRTLDFKPSRFDRYVESLQSNKPEVRIPEVVFTDDEVAGLKLFINANKTQCLQCHNGPLFSNKEFHNVGSGVFSEGRLDFGRVFGVQAVLMDEFNCLGAYSDAPQSQCYALRFLNKSGHLLHGAFKTPSLRNVDATAPYFHDGRYDSLTEVIKHYHKPPKDNGPHELKDLELTEKEMSQLVSFLQSLSESH